MKIVFDRNTGIVSGFGISVQTQAEGSVVEPWLMAAIRNGWDFEGRSLSVWDTSARSGNKFRPNGICCMFIQDVPKFLNPPPKPRGRRAKAAA